MSEGAPERDTLGQMLRIVAHDLRNPLAVIISNLGYLDSCLQGASQDIKETVTDTLTSCEDLKHIIENVDLLGLGLKAQSEPHAPDFVPLDTARAVLKVAQGLALSHGVVLRVDLAGLESKRRVAGDPGNFERAMANLVRNSIQHAPGGSEVQVRAVEEGQTLRFEVDDAGTSLAPPWDSAAFTDRGQVEGKAEGQGRYGRGLGLFSAARAAATMNAELRSSPRPGADGNRFELVLRFLE